MATRTNIVNRGFLSLKQETNSQGLNKVKDFWDLAEISGKWRSQRKNDCGDDSPIKVKAEALSSLLKQRMILVIQGQDQLRWGNNNKGTFNIKEAKGILLGLDSSVPEKTWQHLQKHQGWMKIKVFMWLVHHKKPLTWDNIRKRGVMGPTRCQLYEEQEETMEHILNSCAYTTWLWDSFSTIFQQTDRDRSSITNTLNKWRRNYSENEFLNLASAFMPSFIIWNVWKERNKRIFKNEKYISHRLFDLILKQLHETVSTTVCNLPKNPPSETEIRTLTQLVMQGITPQGLIRKDIAMVTEKDFSQPPPKGYVKYNIDGASKGNLGTTGLGGVLRDEEGSVIFIFHCHLGRATNNMAELMAVEQCLEFLTQNHGSNVVVEADSEITINSVKTINYGTRREKVSNHWKLIEVYQRIQVHLEGLRIVSFNYVRRTANKLRDSLAHQGVNNADCGMAKKWQEIPQNRLKALCEEQATEDREVVRYRARMTSMN